ncbi:MAG: (2Fe-2S)-binding protein [Mailhella sp.]|nr:(2Fe-2S)-binding protein [Mailhella sp.]
MKSVFPLQGRQVTIYVDDAPVTAAEGMTVAAAVLGSGVESTRETACRHEARGPFCHMGVCFECLMEIDGKPNQQACLVAVRDGMRVRRQVGAPDFRVDGMAQA